MPEESCGVLFGAVATPRARLHAAVVTTNTAADPERGFRVDGVAWLRLADRAARRGWQVLGTWHSHPNGSIQPSVADKRAAWPASIVLITVPTATAAGRCRRRLRAWWHGGAGHCTELGVTLAGRRPHAGVGRATLSVVMHEPSNPGAGGRG